MNEKGQILSLTYNGIKITYNESRSVFEYELRGRSRSADTLKAVKEAIDKPAPAKTDEPPFQRFKAYWTGHWNDEAFPIVEVTSIAEYEYGDNSKHAREVWINAPTGRAKVRTDSIFPLTQHNVELANRYALLKKERETISNQMEKTKQKMKQWKL